MAPPIRLTTRPGPAAAPRRARGEDGAAAVELAIVLPLLLLLVFGIIDMGRLLQQQIQLTEAVREGARIGALGGSVATIKGQVTNVVGAAATPTYPTAPTTCSSASAIGDNSTVVAQRAFVPITPLIAIIKMFNSSASPSYTLKATGVMACLG